MQIASSPPATPPPGKTLVCVHRPKSNCGWTSIIGIWDGTKLIGALGSGHSLWFICEPGKHYLGGFGPPPECLSAVEAQLLPDQTYDLWIDPYHGWTHVLQLRPIKTGDKERKQVAIWSKRNLWVERDATAADYEAAKEEVIQRRFDEFISGKERDRLQHLAPEDHR
jgi:hypothetical protein